ncbi:MAG: UDP-N-acetylmuramate dehydrogenase [Gammaproteobacteria bacterium]
MKKPQDTLKLRGTLRRNELLSRHTSWRVGGPVANFYQPHDLDDLIAYLKQLPAHDEIYWIGLGSNLLVRDGGLAGSVICLSGVLKAHAFLDNQRVYVESGMACPRVARLCAKQGLTGAEFLCGIPGTLGGALAMNAGAFGGETWDIVESVKMIDRHGTVHTYTPEHFKISYRHVERPAEAWFVSAVLRLQSGDAAVAQQTIKNLLAKRSGSQPTQQANAGSVFRNPAGDYAARLIESCGLKSVCIGGACVSDKHANFIVNTGTATASDIENLITHVQSIVQQQTGVLLQTEVHIIGRPAQEGA